MLMLLNALSGFLLCTGAFKVPSLVLSVSASFFSENGDAQLMQPHAVAHDSVLPPRPLSEF